MVAPKEDLESIFIDICGDWQEKPRYSDVFASLSLIQRTERSI
jgi:hypothetical protein